MNMSKAISALKMSLGLYGVTLPFQDDDGHLIPTENVIHDVITTITIPTYSQFEPWVREYTINLKDLKVLDRHQHIYELPKFLTMTKVMYVIDVSMPYRSTRGTYGDISPAYGISRSVQGVITAQEYMMVAGQMRAEPTFEYLGHNKIKLYGFPICELSFKVACNHSPNGETIEESCYDSFMELAELDVKKFLWNNLKLYDGIPTAFGNINLKLDDYQSADGDRKQLLDTWRDTFHLDMVDYIEFM